MVRIAIGAVVATRILRVQPVRDFPTVRQAVPIQVQPRRGQAGRGRRGQPFRAVRRAALATTVPGRPGLVWVAPILVEQGVPGDRGFGSSAWRAHSRMAQQEGVPG